MGRSGRELGRWLVWWETDGTACRLPTKCDVQRSRLERGRRRREALSSGAAVASECDALDALKGFGGLVGFLPGDTVAGSYDAEQAPCLPNQENTGSVLTERGAFAAKPLQRHRIMTARLHKAYSSVAPKCLGLVSKIFLNLKKHLLPPHSSRVRRTGHRRRCRLWGLWQRWGVVLGVKMTWTGLWKRYAATWICARKKGKTRLRTIWRLFWLAGRGARRN